MEKMHIFSYKDWKMRNNSSYFYLFLSIGLQFFSDSVFSMQKWGHWYAHQNPQSIGTINAVQESIVQKPRADKRNTLLSSDGIIYINNMFPIIFGTARQLADILIDKGLMTQKDLENICKPLPVFASREIIPADIAVLRCNSLRTFLLGTAEYLEAFNRPELAKKIREKADYV